MKMTKAKGTNPLILTWPNSKNPKGVIINTLKATSINAFMSNSKGPPPPTQLKTSTN